MTTAFKMSRRSFGALASASALSLGMPAIVRAQAAVTLAVPNPSALTWLPIWCAIGEGYFGEEGLALSVEAVDG